MVKKSGKFERTGGRKIADAASSAVAMCDGKEPLTWAQAKLVLGRRRHRNSLAYHCHVCRAWHVGRPMMKHKISKLRRFR